MAIAADCKSALVRVHRFESYRSHTILWCNGNTIGFGPIIQGSNPWGITHGDYGLMVGRKFVALSVGVRFSLVTQNGGMAERLIAPVLKTGILEKVSGVRIPVPPHNGI